MRITQHYCKQVEGMKTLTRQNGRVLLVTVRCWFCLIDRMHNLLQKLFRVGIK
jgi:hypothetical protein